MHSKQEEEQAESRLVDYKKRIGLTREMNSLLNKQTTEVQETPHSKRTRSQALQVSSQAKQESTKRLTTPNPPRKMRYEPTILLADKIMSTTRTIRETL